MGMKSNTDIISQDTVFLVDDDPEILDSLSTIFSSSGYSVKTAASGAEAIERFSGEPQPVVICDYSLPDTKGIDLLKGFRELLPEVQVIMLTGKGTIDIAVSAMKVGMFDFVTKPVDPEHLIELVKRARQLYNALAENKSLKEEVRRMAENYIVGQHTSIKDLYRLIHTVAPTDATVLIEGESGTGKELVARLIHKRSPRAADPFVAVDCGAIPDGLVESELFGHEKGAFTGATSRKAGRFERADGGTLFLDEITSLSLSSQVKLLRVLQEKAIERLGSTRTVPISIRLIAATNTDLQDAVAKKQFREDLYYRLNIVKIKTPSLRERKSDIPLLAEHFIQKHRAKVNSPASGISKEAVKAIMEHSWPGNVRELENAIEHALIMAKDTTIMIHDLPSLSEASTSVSKLDEAERTLLLKAIRDAGGNKYKAAKVLGIPRSSLYSKLQKHGLNNT
jgi:two-component system response regulator HydG